MTNYILVTGASGGLGEDFARQYARAKRNLIIVARSQDRLRALAQELMDRYQVKIEVVAMDLSKPDSASSLFDLCQKSGWDVDMLVNNAGFGLFGNLVDQELSKLDEMMQLNMVTLTKLCRLFLPSMIQKKSGGIINVASTAAFQPVPYFACYAATKSYVMSLSEALTMEAAPHGVKVFCLCPGPTETQFFERAAGRGKAGDKVPKQTSEDVVRFAIKRFESGSRVGVSGALNKLVSLSTGFVPRKIIMKMGEEMMKRANS